MPVRILNSCATIIRREVIAIWTIYFDELSMFKTGDVERPWQTETLAHELGQ
jgi:hypothetical protein